MQDSINSIVLYGVRIRSTMSGTCAGALVTSRRGTSLELL